MVDINDYDHELRVVDEMNDSGLSAQGSRYFEQNRVLDDKNNLRSRELRPLDFMNSSRLRMI